MLPKPDGANGSRDSVPSRWANSPAQLIDLPTSEEPSMPALLRCLSTLTLFATTALVAFAVAAQQPVRVGSKNFTEQFVLAELYAQALEGAGIKVDRKINLGGTLIAHKAL